MSEILGNVFIQFYCLPIWEIIVLLVAATWGFLRAKETFQRHRWWKSLLFLAFLGYSAVILYLTVSSRESTARDVLFLIPFHSYREVLNGGNPELLRSNFMNVVLFYPSGLLLTSLLPEKWPRWSCVLLTVTLFAGLSAGVEYVQYAYGMGQAEIDDVIHNTAGALIGSIAVLRMPSLLVWISGRLKRMWELYDHYRK